MSQSHTMHMTRLWKAMGEPKDLKDSELVRRAAVRIRELERKTRTTKKGSVRVFGCVNKGYWMVHPADSNSTLILAQATANGGEVLIVAGSKARKAQTNRPPLRLSQ